MLLGGVRDKAGLGFLAMLFGGLVGLARRRAAHVNPTHPTHLLM